jgi:hypothetical protein
MSDELTADQVAYLRERAAETRTKWTRHAIVSELYRALERLDAPPELLSIIGSWNDTLSDEEVLRLLKEWNETGKVLHGRQ